MVYLKALIQKLEEKEVTPKELRDTFKINNRRVRVLLEIVRRILKKKNKELVIVPAVCKNCGYVFSKKEISTPWKCPRCKSERIIPPRFYIKENKKRKRR